MKLPHLFLLLFLALPAAAQISVDLALPKRDFLAGESVPATISLTNRSGRDLVFQGTQSQPWVDFIVSSGRGVPLTPVGDPTFGAVKVPAGKTVARSVDLAKLFSFRDLGNYSAYAVVRLPGQGREGFQSRRHRFTISEAQPYWSKTIGVPDTDKTHEYRLIQFGSGRKDQLYAQVADNRNGRVLRTHHLGEFIMLRKPTVTVDASLNMHVLYLLTPSFWGHARISPEGTFIGRDLYKPAEAGNPQFARTNDGTVKVVNGVPYDPEAAREAQEKHRKASDRPAFIYD